ncbi:ParB/RepB/Spo0J family partition protein [Novacetimonas hansenii]|uniref:Chromosome partitioning protein ParB n=2 Tax=Novacetimonas hansenii TaxID=436 RepID=A0ABQ0SAC0_NOVHA|nr:ParB/RepB/Spo0J family partition protein [Novacetimonas hansenii]EFG85828.1 parB-like partition protein [Novacetimonas hansenii ATCC 23769]MBL7237929.1 ParB/RepB/Spo0J family partition protein [Novacetimonas hansenii]QOF95276.1 ParB/RepB/Spo0J family partition protein [Novacetimonas hansenii]GAN82398.1 chromosome partitioning nuclease protein ParB [Novacetimonas hansenii JCM 7643]GBQ53437.1 chromosome partitioning protein ParB [Novacetimonas hansenii NRIC 0243]
MKPKKDAARPRLGRGLAALLGDQVNMLNPAPGLEPRKNMDGGSVLPVDVLEPGPFQPRQHMAPEALEELADSIRTRGILQPILVRPHPDRPNMFQIIAGERRWRAAQLASLHEVPVHIRALDDGDAMAAALVENLQRADLNAMEEAEGLQRLLDDYRLTQEELAGAIGKSRPHVANMVRLLQLPPPVRDAVRDRELSAGHARALLAHPDPVAALKVVLKQGLNVRQTEALSKKTDAKNKVAAKREEQAHKDPEIGSLERDLTAKLGLKVQITFDGKGGSLRVDYRSLDQFDGLLRLLQA